MGVIADPRSAAVALAAGALAAIGVYAVVLDEEIAGRAAVGWVLVLDAVAALAVAFLPGRGAWAGRLRAGAFFFAALSLFAGIPLSLLASAETGCACAHPAGWVAPSILWIGARTWTRASLIAAPLLTLGAAVVGRRGSA